MQQNEEKSRSAFSVARGGLHRDSEWLAMVEDAEFRALVGRKRRYLLTGWFLVAGGYLGLATAAALAPEWFERPLLGELNLGLLWVIGEVMLTLAVAWLYVRRAGPRFDTDAQRLAKKFRFRSAS